LHPCRAGDRPIQPILCKGAWDLGGPGRGMEAQRGHRSAEGARKDWEIWKGRGGPEGPLCLEVGKKKGEKRKRKRK
jgi:hypothetical protein